MPWNGVRITFNISLEAAQRLKQLALCGDVNLRNLGILAVQLQDDQTISLNVGNNLNQPKELLVRNRDEESASTPPSSLSSPSSPSSSSSSLKISQNVNSSLIGNNTCKPPEAVNVKNSIQCATETNLSVEGTRRNIAEYLNNISFEASISSVTPPSEIVPCLDEIETNSHEQIPVEVELPNSELVDVDLTIKCEDSYFDADSIRLQKDLPELVDSPSVAIQDAIIDSESNLDVMSHSVACGDHNYTSLKNPCIDNDQDPNLLNMEEPDDKEDHNETISHGETPNIFND
ncbi:uncharacterized protein LOC107370147 isoform X2 [Tetranychus urticae]|uniref:Nuclear receptor coactivator 6 TRADD-N domain-containing protein n=1 Tax=Tetranychus urticae TaxID=32264 RepID=T1L409_TETUR|nr:uncharacterized protein LOC107370147 isoform X2 [Tetranychus urticae]